ncbi:MAG: bifunctional (p)ppGpp synthetase/guanosine-3',5'-bis(diphosphate) 3'-pyrophosphohydrolase [Clostridiales bacterium]|jgi:GTP pyrophosphokinase|nr:bifunctional (p)ppGpp synthetase/guanosine-3',5'-bis(diphosphate) 3'-pyrophosphohydrolase [Clostridiales bacterium]
MNDILMDMYDELILKIKTYHPSKEFSLVEKAYLIAKEAHGQQIRNSGEPYIIHPLSVSIILAELEMDLESIIAGILHDVIEDTKYSYGQIVEMFGSEIAGLVDGVTKLEMMTYTKAENQAATYRKLLLAMAKDIRVIIIKIADRLHNMRTLSFKPPEKQKITAQETLDIYAPIAARLGINSIKDQLEDLSFKYLNGEEYDSIKNAVLKINAEHKEFIESVSNEIREKIRSSGLDCEVYGRSKNYYSIYRKMRDQNKTIDQIYDLFAFRVVVNTDNECYTVLGILHEKYLPVPDRFKDYISIKKNGIYQSLHTTLVGPNGVYFEVQIRTWDMHKTAEYGIAAHWKYKSHESGLKYVEKEEEKLDWLRQILDWQREFSDNDEFVSELKTGLIVFQEQVYCFSPKGKLLRLQAGSTPIDFAYNVHTNIGNTAVGAIVNGKMAPINTILKSGDKVEIVTNKNSKPSLDWLEFVKTSSARNGIRQYYRQQDKGEFAKRGKELLEKEAKVREYPLSKLLNKQRLSYVLNKYSYKDFETLCAAVGREYVKATQLMNRLINRYEKENHIDKELKDDKGPELDASKLNIDKPEETYTARKGTIVVNQFGDLEGYRLSKCCGPVPGDEIVCYVTRGRGVSVHRKDCINMLNLSEEELPRLLEAQWNVPEKSRGTEKYRSELIIKAFERNKLLQDILYELSQSDIPIRSMLAHTNNDISLINVGIEICSKEQLNKVKNKILGIDGVIEVQRNTT